MSTNINYTLTPPLLTIPMPPRATTPTPHSSNSSSKMPVRLGKAIITGAAKVVPIRRSSRPVATPIGPQPGEQPAFNLKIQVCSCKDLLAMDSNGKSDPYVVVSLLRKREKTPVIKATLDPVYPPKDATFEFPIYLSLAETTGALELIVWDKDVIGSDYLGEIALPIQDWFQGQPILFDDPANEPFIVPLVSTRANTPSSGVIELKTGLVVQSMPDAVGAYKAIVQRAQGVAPTLTTAPPTEGVGTVRSENGHGPIDDGFCSDEETDEEDYQQPPLAAATVIASTALVAQTESPSASDTEKKKSKFIPAFLTSRRASSPALVNNENASGILVAPTTADGMLAPGRPIPSRTASGSSTKSGRPRFKRGSSKPASYNLGTHNDVLGIVMIEIEGATDLPKLPNMTRTGWDMDPFVVISFSKKIFRTRILRHSLNPIWKEKLFFHVRQYESGYNIQFKVLDWDKLSGNDFVGDSNLNVARLIEGAPKPDPTTGVYKEALSTTGVVTMKEFTLPLTPQKEVKWETRHSPQLTFRAGYQPYDMLRQQFWAQYLRQYDADETNTISHVEITSMLDSLGSTLSRSTIDSFFTRYGKAPSTGELTIEEAVDCLEEEVSRPVSQKKRLSQTDDFITASHTECVTPMYEPNRSQQDLTKLSFNGPAVGGLSASPKEEVQKKLSEGSHDDRNQGLDTQPGQPSGNTLVIGQVPYPAGSAPEQVEKILKIAHAAQASGGNSTSGSDDDLTVSSGDSDEGVERVINIKTCPLCHQPRLKNKGEMDIVTHLAICASGDWSRVDRIVVGNFVTASQAQRKWYTTVMNKITTGAYSLGANSANIIVQNRMTGQLEEEKMQVYVRLGIRLLYKGAKSQMEGARARSLLKSMSVKQGIKYDDPASAAEIPAFIEFHKLNVNEIRDPIESFKSFNQFFYRKLKEDARPAEKPEDPRRIVSAADCRLMAFETINEATRIWIKGREFSVAKLLGERYKDEVAEYNGGALVIFRLAPQDYHRFHSPVDGKVGPVTLVDGEYYTVNPQAIRTTLDVYGENVRKIVPIDSPTFGRVYNVCIGAMMVGSIDITVNEGDTVARGQDFGYFAFGGSTIVTIFKRGQAVWDDDLLINGRASLETLVRVGMGIGYKSK